VEAETVREIYRQYHSDPLYAGCFYLNRRDSRTHKVRRQPEWLAVAVPAIIDAGAFDRATTGLDRLYCACWWTRSKLDGNELVVSGSQRRLADAFGFMDKRKLGEVPSFVHDWRASVDETENYVFSGAL